MLINSVFERETVLSWKVCVAKNDERFYGLPAKKIHCLFRGIKKKQWMIDLQVINNLCHDLFVVLVVFDKNDRNC